MLLSDNDQEEDDPMDVYGSIPSRVMSSLRIANIQFTDAIEKTVDYIVGSHSLKERMLSTFGNSPDPLKPFATLLDLEKAAIEMMMEETIALPTHEEPDIDVDNTVLLQIIYSFAATAVVEFVSSVLTGGSDISQELKVEVKRLKNSSEEMAREEIDEEEGADQQLDASPSEDKRSPHYELVMRHLQPLLRRASGKRKSTPMRLMWNADNDTLRHLFGTSYPDGGINLELHLPALMRPRGSRQSHTPEPGKKFYMLYCIFTDLTRPGQHGSAHAVVMEVLPGPSPKTIHYYSITQGVAEMFKGIDSRSVPNGWTMSEVYIHGMWISTGALREKLGNNMKMRRGTNQSKLNIPQALPSHLQFAGGAPEPKRPKLEDLPSGSGEFSLPDVPPRISEPIINSVLEIRNAAGKFHIKAQIRSKPTGGNEDEVVIPEVTELPICLHDSQKDNLCERTSKFLNDLTGDNLFSTFMGKNGPSEEWLLAVKTKRNQFHQKWPTDGWIIQSIESLSYYFPPGQSPIGIAKARTLSGDKVYKIESAITRPDFLQALISFLNGCSTRIVTYLSPCVEYFIKEMESTPSLQTT